MARLPATPAKKAMQPPPLQPTRMRAEKAAARERQVPDAAREDEESVRRQALAGTVLRRIREAMQARASSGIEEIWQDDDDQYNGVDALTLNVNSRRSSETSGQINRRTIADGRSKIFMNITKPKTQAGVARVKEMLLPTDDRPWSLGPTPIPELTSAAEADPQRMVTLADGSQAPAADVAAITMEKARTAADKMAEWVEDRFVEGDVYAQLRLVIEDAGRIGTGVIKGPYAVARKDRTWKTDPATGMTALEVIVKNEPSSRKIDPRDCFPDPSCGENIHNGGYFIERDYLTGRGLRALAFVDGYDSAAIIAALKEGPQKRARATDRNAGRAADRDGSTENDSAVFEVYYYYGDCSPSDLEMMGVDLIEGEALLLGIPAIVTMLNGRIIRATVNPMETGEFPYDFFVWEPVAGQPWGRGLPFKMAAAQVMLVAAVRSLLENAGLSAGAQIAFMEGALKPMPGEKYEIAGRKLWKFTPTAQCNDITKALHVFTIPSAQQELSAIIQFALQMADELTNLPQLMQGQNNREGQQAAPQTFGGMTMLMNSANAPLRVIAKQFDDTLIVPHLRRYYDWGMQSGPADAKGDHQIKALGSTVLVQREAAREFLMQGYQLAGDPELGIDKSKWFAALSKSYGFSVSEIRYDEAERKQRDEQRSQNPPPQDPRVEAAQIRAKADEADRQARSQEAAADRQARSESAQASNALHAQIAEIQRDIQIMRLAAEENMQIGTIKADLAGKAMDNRTKRTEMGLKLNPQNRSGLGI